MSDQLIGAFRLFAMVLGTSSGPTVIVFFNRGSMSDELIGAFRSFAMVLGTSLRSDNCSFF